MVRKIYFLLIVEQTSGEAYGPAYWAAETPAICTGTTSGAIVGNNCYDD
ncbi:MAG: hypothetical protein JKX68_00820, partial [Flavobacteriales bacterium]|nr:hypothetical protein [Flavobacteriales bacterium]